MQWWRALSGAGVRVNQARQHRGINVTLPHYTAIALHHPTSYWPSDGVSGIKRKVWSLGLLFWNTTNLLRKPFPRWNFISKGGTEEESFFSRKIRPPAYSQHRSIEANVVCREVLVTGRVQHSGRWKMSACKGSIWVASQKGFSNHTPSPSEWGERLRASSGMEFQQRSSPLNCFCCLQPRMWLTRVAHCLSPPLVASGHPTWCSHSQEQYSWSPEGFWSGPQRVTIMVGVFTSSSFPWEWMEWGNLITLQGFLPLHFHAMATTCCCPSKGSCATSWQTRQGCQLSLQIMACSIATNKGPHASNLCF